MEKNTKKKKYNPKSNINEYTIDKVTQKYLSYITIIGYETIIKYNRAR